MMACGVKSGFESVQVRRLLVWLTITFTGLES